MNTFAIAAAASIFAASSAYAADVTVFGNTEYQIEAERVESNLGLSYGIQNWTFTPLMTLDYTDADNLEFDGAELSISYQFVNKDKVEASAYIRVEADEDFDYSETAVGVSYSF